MGKIMNFNGVPLYTPNDITDVKPTHHISYNNSIRDYGCDTTAIVLTDHTKFYILNGNHSKELKDKTLNECLEYFRVNQDKIALYSDKLD